MLPRAKNRAQRAIEHGIRGVRAIDHGVRVSVAQCIDQGVRVSFAQCVARARSLVRWPVVRVLVIVCICVSLLIFTSVSGGGGSRVLISENVGFSNGGRDVGDPADKAQLSPPDATRTVVDAGEDGSEFPDDGIGEESEEVLIVDKHVDFKQNSTRAGPNFGRPSARGPEGVSATGFLLRTALGVGGVAAAAGATVYARKRRRKRVKGHGRRSSEASVSIDIKDEDDAEVPLTAKKPFVCTTCGARFRQKGNLTVHERAHTQEKKFQCDICDESFHRQQNLKTHMRTHTKEKPYFCDICGKRTAQLSNFKRHYRTHLGGFGAQPYPCTYCEKRYADKRNLLHHASKQHPDKPPPETFAFRCPYCDKGFNRANHRDDHIMSCDKLTEEQLKAEVALQRHTEGGARPRSGLLKTSAKTSSRSRSPEPPRSPPPPRKPSPSPSPALEALKVKSESSSSSPVYRATLVTDNDMTPSMSSHDSKFLPSSPPPYASPTVNGLPPPLQLSPTDHSAALGKPIGGVLPSSSGVPAQHSSFDAGSLHDSKFLPDSAAGKSSSFTSLALNGLPPPLQLSPANHSGVPPLGSGVMLPDLPPTLPPLPELYSSDGSSLSMPPSAVSTDAFASFPGAPNSAQPLQNMPTANSTLSSASLNSPSNGYMKSEPYLQVAPLELKSSEGSSLNESSASPLVGGDRYSFGSLSARNAVVPLHSNMHLPPLPPLDSGPDHAFSATAPPLGATENLLELKMSDGPSSVGRISHARGTGLSEDMSMEISGPVVPEPLPLASAVEVDLNPSAHQAPPLPPYPQPTHTLGSDGLNLGQTSATFFPSPPDAGAHDPNASSTSAFYEDHGLLPMKQSRELSAPKRMSMVSDLDFLSTHNKEFEIELRPAPSARNSKSSITSSDTAFELNLGRADLSSNIASSSSQDRVPLPLSMDTEYDSLGSLSSHPTSSTSVQLSSNRSPESKLLPAQSHQRERSLDSVSSRTTVSENSSSHGSPHSTQPDGPSHSPSSSSRSNSHLRSQSGHATSRSRSSEMSAASTTRTVFDGSNGSQTSYRSDGVERSRGSLSESSQSHRAAASIHTSTTGSTQVAPSQASPHGSESSSLPSFTPPDTSSALMTDELSHSPLGGESFTREDAEALTLDLRYDAGTGEETPTYGTSSSPATTGGWLPSLDTDNALESASLDEGGGISGHGFSSENFNSHSGTALSPRAGSRWSFSRDSPKPHLLSSGARNHSSSGSLREANFDAIPHFTFQESATSTAPAIGKLSHPDDVDGDASTRFQNGRNNLQRADSSYDLPSIQHRTIFAKVDSHERVMSVEDLAEETDNEHSHFSDHVMGTSSDGDSSGLDHVMTDASLGVFGKLDDKYATNGIASTEDGVFGAMEDDDAMGLHSNQGKSVVSPVS